MRQVITPQLDLFYQWPNHKLGRELKKISEILDRHPEFAVYVHNDLSGGKTQTGSLGMSAEQILRAGIIKSILKLTYEKLSFNTSDSMATRSFLLMNLGESISSSCLQENVSRVNEKTWEIISKSLVLDAKTQGFENCKTARVDSTVTDTNIAYPTDSKLLYDCIRVIDREFKKVRKLADKKSWRLSSTKQVSDAKSLRYKINNSRNAKERLPHYKKLLHISKSIKSQMPNIIGKIEKAFIKKNNLERPFTILKDLDLYLEKIIHQTEKRVLKNQTVPVHKKIVSIFEPHTDIIVKDRRETQFGHKVFITSGKSNMILHCDLPEGNPCDSKMFLPTINSLKKSYDVMPRKLSADGGFSSKENVLKAKEMGVKDICFPKKCNMKITEMVRSSYVYETLLKWRAGIEAVISFLKRCFGLGKASWSGLNGYKKCVRCGIASYNLLVLARHELLA